MELQTVGIHLYQIFDRVLYKIKGPKHYMSIIYTKINVYIHINICIYMQK